MKSGFRALKSHKNERTGCEPKKASVIFLTREKLVSCVDVAQKRTKQFAKHGGKWWQVVASGGTVVAHAGTPGGIRGAARLRQKLSEFDRF